MAFVQGCWWIVSSLGWMIFPHWVIWVECLEFLLGESWHFPCIVEWIFIKLNEFSCWIKISLYSFLMHWWVEWYTPIQNSIDFSIQSKTFYSTLMLKFSLDAEFFSFNAEIMNSFLNDIVTLWQGDKYWISFLTKSFRTAGSVNIRLSTKIKHIGLNDFS